MGTINAGTTDVAVASDGKAVGPERHADGRRAAPRPLLVTEGVLLLLATPPLLSPEAAPALTIAALFVLAFSWLISLRFAAPPITPFNLILLLWGLALVVGIVVTADPAETLPKATGLILGLAVWRYLVLAVRTRRALAVAVAVYLLLGLGLSLVGIFGLQELPKMPLLAELNPFRGRSLPGLGGLTTHPNHLAALICLYLPLLVSLGFALPGSLSTGESASSYQMGQGRASHASQRFSPGKGGRVLLIAATLMAAALLVLTQSRGGWIAALAGLFALLILWLLVLPPGTARRRLRLAAVVWVVAGLAAVLWVGPGTLRDLWLNPPAESAVGPLITLNYRKELWPWAVTAVGDFPFTGLGLGAFRQVAFRLYPLALPTGQDIGHAHNIFLQTALDVGLPGLVVYLALLLVAVAVGWRVARADAGLRAVALGLMAGLFALHVFGLADALALGAKPGVVFWFALGLLAAMNGLVRPRA